MCGVSGDTNSLRLIHAARIVQNGIIRFAKGREHTVNALEKGISHRGGEKSEYSLMKEIMDSNADEV